MTWTCSFLLGWGCAACVWQAGRMWMCASVFLCLAKVFCTTGLVLQQLASLCIDSALLKQLSNDNLSPGCHHGAYGTCSGFRGSSWFVRCLINAQSQAQCLLCRGWLCVCVCSGASFFQQCACVSPCAGCNCVAEVLLTTNRCGCAIADVVGVPSCSENADILYTKANANSPQWGFGWHACVFAPRSITDPGM